MIYKTYFNFAQLNIEVCSERKILYADIMTPFLNKDEMPKESVATYGIHFKKYEIDKNAELISRKTEMEVYTDDSYIYTVYPVKDANVDTQIILVRKKEHAKEYAMYIEPKCEEYFAKNFVMSSYMALEEVLANNDGFILHASFIKWENNGILFSAPSGVGKSTQADLWQKHENAYIINGDRVLIRKVGNKYYGYGSFFAGSSHIYNNEAAQIKALIILKQAPVNEIRTVKPMEAFVNIYSQTLVNKTNSEYQTCLVDNIEKMIDAVKIYELKCTPDKRAVKILKEHILNEN